MKRADTAVTKDFLGDNKDEAEKERGETKNESFYDREPKRTKVGAPICGVTVAGPDFCDAVRIPAYEIRYVDRFGHGV